MSPYKILHILDHYKPHFSGYVFRTSYILKYQREFGLEPVVVTSPKHGEVKSDIEEIDNIKVYRTSPNDFGMTPFIREKRLMVALQKRIEDVIQKEKPDIIHAHSPSLNGIPALRAGKKYGIPVVYEIRAFWEDAAVTHGTYKDESIKYRISRFLETRLTKGVDAIFTICEGLKRELISRGIPEDKITIIPNCVDTRYFSPAEYNVEIADKYGLKGNTVFGFIGSFYQYEGLDLLIDAFSKALGKVNDIRLLLVGDGPEKERLFEKAGRMNLLGRITFTGKVPHDEIKRYYSVMDILVYPRKGMRLTELVTPLKPLESMAMGKIVVGSDVGGIRELITRGENGLLFKAGDVDELTRLLIELVFKKKDLGGISKRAIEMVRAKHNWESAVKKYVPVYNRLVKNKVCAGL